MLLASGVQLTGIALVQCGVEINELLQGMGIFWVCGWSQAWVWVVG